jgi:hypothetical protein
MKKLFIILGSLLLVVSLLINVASIYAVRFEYDWDKELLQSKKTDIYNLRNAEILQLINKSNQDSPSPDQNSIKLDSAKSITQKFLKDVGEELISISGGFLQDATIYNPTEKMAIDHYFYEDNYYRPMASKDFQKHIKGYIITHKKVTGNSSFLEAIPIIYSTIEEDSYYKIFNNLTLSESLTVLDLIGTKIEMDYYMYIDGIEPIY